MTTQNLPARQVRAGSSMKEGFTGTELAVRSETSGEVLAARAQAEVFGAMTLAKRFPRDIEEVRERVLKDCQRRGFAENARYSLPRGGKKIEGFTVRFAESLMRHLGNMYATQIIAYDDPFRRTVSIRVIDLETNNTMSAEASVDKTVERSSNDNSRDLVGQRVNSNGKPVYILTATEDEVNQKLGIATSKALRNCVIRMTPSDILDDAEIEIQKTMRGGAKGVSAADRERTLERYASLGYSSADLAAYLGRPFEACTPQELQELQELFPSVRDEECDWNQLVESRKQARTPYSIERLLSGYDACLDKAHLTAIEKETSDLWPKISKSDKEILKKALDATRKRIADGMQPVSQKDQPPA